MTQDEKQALLQFMGLTYGAAVKMDRDIVNPSNQLTPISESIKQHFEQLLPAQVDNTPHTPDFVSNEPLEPPPDLPEPVVQFTQPIEPVTATLATSDVVTTLQDIRVALFRIVDILEEQPNDKPIKPTKKSKNQLTR